MATTKVRYNQIKTGLPTGGDVNYNDVSLLLTMEGSNGSTTFTDKGPNSYSVSTNGSPSISTAQSKFGTGSYYNNNNASTYLSVDPEAVTFGSNDFTIEAWLYVNDISDTSYITSTYTTEKSNGNSSNFGFHESNGLVYYTAIGSNDQIYIYEGSTSGWSVNTWYHIAVTRSGNTFRIFKDGIEKASSTYSGDTYVGSKFILFNGHWVISDNALDGYVSSLRITKNVARYTSNFSVPTAAFPALESKEGKEFRVGANGTIELES